MIVQVIRIWNLRFIWYLMLGIWDFVDSVPVFKPAQKSFSMGLLSGTYSWGIFSSFHSSDT